MRRELESLRKLDDCRRWRSFTRFAVELSYQLVRYKFVGEQLSGGDGNLVGYLEVQGRIG